MSGTSRNRRIPDVQWLRRQLSEMRFYVDDPELRERINSWIDKSHSLSDADTASEYVESRLREMAAEFPMYHSPEIRRGEDAFPDDCESCPHYGASCPVLTDPEEEDWRERKLDEAESERDAEQVYHRQATDTGCVVIPRLLSRWHDTYGQFVQKGESLLAEAEETLKEQDAPAARDSERWDGDGDEDPAEAHRDLFIGDTKDAFEDDAIGGTGGDKA